MTEAARAVVEWTLSQPDIYRVWAVCDVDNAASAKVPEKVGMRREGVLRRWIIHPNIDAMPRDCYCYAIIKQAAPHGAVYSRRHEIQRLDYCSPRRIFAKQARALRGETYVAPPSTRWKSYSPESERF